jgi:hypothetical protein
MATYSDVGELRGLGGTRRNITFSLFPLSLSSLSFIARIHGNVACARRRVYTVGSCFVSVRFTTIHFYDPCQVGPSTPDLRCIAVATQASFLYLVRF